MSTTRGARLLRIRAIEHHRTQMECQAAEQGTRRIELLQARLKDAGAAMQINSASVDASGLRSRDEFLERLAVAATALERSHDGALDRLAQARIANRSAAIAKQRVERLNDKARAAEVQTAEDKRMRQYVHGAVARR